MLSVRRSTHGNREVRRLGMGAHSFFVRLKLALMMRAAVEVGLETAAFIAQVVREELVVNAIRDQGLIIIDVGHADGLQLSVKPSSGRLDG